MQESEFREWLEANGATSEAARNTRIGALKVIERRLSDLGFDDGDIEAAWRAGKFDDLREALTELGRDARDGGEKYKVLMPESEKPRLRLANWRNWLGQYGRFLAGEGVGTKDADKVRQYVLEQLIEPARAEELEEIELVVRDINDALGLNDAWPNICQALRGSRFQELAGVPPPESFGADMSSATRFRIGLDADRSWATSVLNDRYGEPIKETKKLSAFALADGREVAVETEPGPVKIWVEGNVAPAEGLGTIEPYAANSPRHSNLPPRLSHLGAQSRPASRVIVFNADGLAEMLDRYEKSSAALDRTALLELKARFLNAFPNFVEDGGFSGSARFRSQEDAYKRDLIAAAGKLVQEFSGDSVGLGAALVDLAGGKGGLPSNLIHWMMYDNLKKRMSAFPGEFEAAFAAIALSDDPSEAIRDFNDKLWAKAFASPANNPFGDSRTLPTTIAALTHPNASIAIRTDRFNRLSKLLHGKPLFAQAPLSAAELKRTTTIAEELFVVMRDEWNWHPRDLWDVQSFIWVACDKPAAGGREQLDATPIWIVTARFGQNDGLDDFIDRGYWSLLTDTGSINNERVREMKVGDIMVARDYFHQTHSLPFDANGKRITAIRVRAIGRITEESDDGLRVGVNWTRLESPRNWYFYTHNEPIWRLKAAGEDPYADALRAFLLNDEEQDYDWFLNDPYWKTRLFGKDELMQAIAPPTNLILYGPPGTGKTYHTALEAVRLCDGSSDFSDDDDGRAALMARYQELIDARQVEFVTFHQSYSYEDFVEGLRPETSADASGTGFRLKEKDGIFKRIADKAKKSVIREGGLTLEGRKVFKLSLGRANDPKDSWVYDEAIDDGFALLGFADVDLSNPQFATKDAILAEMQSRFPGENITPQMGIVKSPDRFRNQIGVGDLIVVSKGLNAFRAVGLVEGDYEYAPRENGHYCHRRKVKWLWEEPDGLPVGELSPDKRFSLDTVYEIPHSRLNLGRLRQLINVAQEGDAGEVVPHVLIIDEINRANVSKVFGELITLLEPDKRLGMLNAIRVRLPYSQTEFGVPANLHIVGTMNSADRSIALLDTALRRRFQFREMAPDCSVQAFQDAEQATGLPLSSFLHAINRRIEYLVDRDHRIGHAFFIGCQDPSDVDRVMRDKIIPLLQEYFFDDWDRLAAVLGDSETVRNFLEFDTIEDPMGEGAAIRSWRIRDAFPREAYLRCAGELIEPDQIVAVA